MLTMRITPNASVKPLAMRKSNAAENRPFSVWTMKIGHSLLVAPPSYAPAVHGRAPPAGAPPAGAPRPAGSGGCGPSTLVSA